MFILPSTKNYEIIITEDIFEGRPESVYGVQNKHTEVIEIKDSILTRIYEMMVQLEQKFQEMEGSLSSEVTSFPGLKEADTQH